MDIKFLDVLLPMMFEALKHTIIIPEVAIVIGLIVGSLCGYLLESKYKIGMAIGTALLAGLLGKYGYVANQTQNAAVLSIMKHAFTTIPGILWIVTAVVLFFYRLNKKRYNEIVEDLKNGKRG